MSSSDEPRELNTNDWNNLENLADSLEEAWKKGQSVDLGKFVPPAGPQRMAILLELIKTDACRNLMKLFF